MRIGRTDSYEQPTGEGAGSGGDEEFADDRVISYLFRLVQARRRQARPSAPTPDWARPHEKPQPTGVRLITSGEYGRVWSKLESRAGRKNVATQLLSRGSRLRPVFKEDIVSGLVPNTNGTTVVEEDANIYCAQFSADSSFYYTGTQDFKISVYDMTASPTQPEKPDMPPQPRRHRWRQRSYIVPPVQSTLKTIKTIRGAQGQWTMTDTHLSPDNERVIYSSLCPVVYMATTHDSSETQIPINFSGRRTRVPAFDYDDELFRVYSCRFSADGNEIVAGGSSLICVYDLLANKRTVRIHAHNDDINSCCWADTASGNVLVSASDDTTLKVWDRRSLGSSQKPSGVLVGHTEGITYVSAKGDGRYVISNGKDQALRLWDLRKMRTNDEWESVSRQDYRDDQFDYRHLPAQRYAAHPKDCSVMTYRGHSVLQTLIRCHFSPAETTGSQYVYSGSYDGRIHIWSLDGRVVQVLDRARTLPLRVDPSAPEPEPMTSDRESVCVRDVSWHPREPVLLSAAFESSRGGSSVARHEWKGLTKTKGALEDCVERQRLEAAETPRRLPGQFVDDDGDDGWL
ncbi:WD40-repeat-containing domain protein [Vararia minispora EC-137]|uniref:WD40-repeat-containing domain protein n=1 Tax=Vararia minispora EC-137 TaxID=1314806 RepID=A0ACB8QHP4_9AGAM|nr:WD40-repeat-containing domain protein [Vararia minispora EC-137]